MKHIQKLRKLILALGIFAGMSMIAHAEETVKEKVITATGTTGNLNSMFPCEGIDFKDSWASEYNVAVDDNIIHDNSYFYPPNGYCFTKVEVTKGKNPKVFFTGRTTYGVHDTSDIETNSDGVLEIQFTVVPYEVYNVTLHTNGGTINSGNITSYTEFGYAKLPTDVTKTGYTFEGWYTNSDLSGDKVEWIYDSTGDKEYWAKWESDPTYTITITAKADPYNTGAYYATFYDSTKSYTADCEVYYATENAGGRFTLEKAEGNVIKAGEGVILKATGETVTLTKTTTEASYDSLLTGSDTETSVENALVLSLGKNGVWFYKYSGTLGANKAYLAQ